ncbi:MAG: hypothetical protein ABI972_26615 [Acidobacteriota bacterium]
MRILAIAILAGSVLHAAEVVHLRDEGADAFFPKSECCIVTTYQVNVSAGTMRIPSDEPAQQQSTVALAIGRFDVCTGTQVMSAFGIAPVTSAEFQIAQDLSTASLRVSLALLDQSGHSVLTTISLTWTATDSLTKGTNSFHTSAPGMRVNGRLHGRSRVASASGQIVENGVTVLLDQSVFAQMRQSSSGTVIIN